MKRLLLTGTLLCLLPAAVAAQCPPPLVPPDLQTPCQSRYPTWSGELAVLGGNMLLGGFSAGVLQKLNGGSFGDGFLHGLAGGAVLYGGKRIAVERFGGAGLVGREVAAVGASMVRNAGEDRGLLDQVVLPVGPVRLYFSQAGGPRLRARADLSAIGWMVWAMTQPELQFDRAMSLSSGTMVFRAEDRVLVVDGDSSHGGGLVGSGVIVLADVPQFGRPFARRVFEHERVHVLQMDQLFLTVTDPAEDFVLRRIPGVRRIEPYVDVNLSDQLLRRLAGVFGSHLKRPWETEALFLSR